MIGIVYDQPGPWYARLMVGIAYDCQVAMGTMGTMDAMDAMDAMSTMSTMSTMGGL